MIPCRPVLELYPAASGVLRPGDTVLSSFPRSGRTGPVFYRRGRVAGWSGTLAASTVARLSAGAQELLAAVRH